jgi:hypothetical protein
LVDVTVKLRGGTRSGSAAPEGPIEFSLPDAATAGELLRVLAERFAEPLRSALLPPGDGLPTRIRLFIDGQMAERRDQPIVGEGDRQTRVVVVLASPVAGGL